MAIISIKDLFEAGAHFGHKTYKWHPKMKEYIYGAKSGIYIIDLRKTLQKLKEAYEAALKISANGGKILFVGTKFQAREIIAEEAQRSDNFFVNLRWLGGMMTNFNTIKQSIVKLKRLEEQAGPEGNYPGILKKEAVRLERERRKLESVLGGILELRKTPAAVFIMDIKREFIALNEAKKLGVPIISVVDTNCDPRGVDYVIPGNDDSTHCIKLFTRVIATASIEGRKLYERKIDEMRREKLKADEEAKEKRMRLKAERQRKEAEAKAKEEQARLEEVAAKEEASKEAKPETSTVQAEPPKEVKPEAPAVQEEPLKEAKPEEPAVQVEPPKEAKPEAPAAEPAEIKTEETTSKEEDAG